MTVPIRVLLAGWAEAWSVNSLMSWWGGTSVQSRQAEGEEVVEGEGRLIFQGKRQQFYLKAVILLIL